MDDKKKLYEMGLHDVIEIYDDVEVIRVPGGWIYTNIIENKNGKFGMCSTFVPMDLEFRKLSDIL